MSSVHHIIKSMASGYIVVAVQAVIGIIMVPYLISERNLGLEKYGTLMLIQSSVAILTVLLDGLRLESARLIGKSIITKVFALDEINIIALVLSFLLGCVYLLILTNITPGYSNLYITNEIINTSIVLVAAFIIEQIYYAIDSHFHATQKSLISNALSIADTVTRALFIFLMFEYINADIAHYAQAIFLCLGIKYLAARAILRQQNYNQDKMSTKSIIRVVRGFKSAPTQTLQGLSPYMIFRGAVILSGLRLGTEQAAVVAIFIQTLRNYFNQAVFSGLRPFILPFLSATQNDEVQRKGINKFFIIYQLIVLTIGGVAAVTAEFWFPLWLGHDLGKYYYLTWIVLIGYSVEVALLFHYYDLIAAGKSLGLAYLTFCGALLALLIMYFTPPMYMNIENYLWIVTGYILYWSVLVVSIKTIKGKA
ncbi:hypothetical protein IVG45_18070 [Methylomonas sp. LL1]|uniref:lipopolysaccharide biosynthesis protein n=1 Tax=Methylomonas sp. LL1 TaxID=2785785 RepID=UPI0018C3FEEC|nr:hypothetical protein [Methylomonas sp. LL1]QPK62722.1 hypothetical protein IVG45_18070 [Methylomonas sp. LL1]